MTQHRSGGVAHPLMEGRSTVAEEKTPCTETVSVFPGRLFSPPSPSPRPSPPVHSNSTSSPSSSPSSSSASSSCSGPSRPRRAHERRKTVMRQRVTAVLGSLLALVLVLNIVAAAARSNAGGTTTNNGTAKCIDRSPYCNHNDCVMRPGYAMEYCAQSCARCKVGGGPACRDSTVVDCSRRRRDECDDMLKDFCPVLCGVCRPSRSVSGRRPITSSTSTMVAPLNSTSLSTTSSPPPPPITTSMIAMTTGPELLSNILMDEDDPPSPPSPPQENIDHVALPYDFSLPEAEDPAPGRNRSSLHSTTDHHHGNQSVQMLERRFPSASSALGLPSSDAANMNGGAEYTFYGTPLPLRSAVQLNSLGDFQGPRHHRHSQNNQESALERSRLAPPMPKSFTGRAMIGASDDVNVPRAPTSPQSPPPPPPPPVAPSGNNMRRPRPVVRPAVIPNFGRPLASPSVRRRHPGAWVVPYGWRVPSSAQTTVHIPNHPMLGGYRTVPVRLIPSPFGYIMPTGEPVSPPDEVVTTEPESGTTSGNSIAEDYYVDDDVSKEDDAPSAYPAPRRRAQEPPHVATASPPPNPITPSHDGAVVVYPFVVHPPATTTAASTTTEMERDESVPSARFPNYPTPYSLDLNFQGPAGRAGRPLPLVDLIALLGCRDKDPHVCALVTDDACHSRPGYYLKLCPVKCRNCNGLLCYDSIKLNCAEVLRTGGCSEPIAHEYCPRSCGRCHPPAALAESVSQCKDELETCPQLAEGGVCNQVYSEAVMRLYCAKSCRFCRASQFYLNDEDDGSTPPRPKLALPDRRKGRKKGSSGKKSKG